MTSAAKVIAIGDAFGASEIENWLEAHPDVVELMSRAGARVILFEPPWVEPLEFIDALRAALAHAELAVPPDVRLPLFVPTVVAAVLRDLGMLWKTDRVPPVSPQPSRGILVGYFALGEGGAVFAVAGPDPREDPAVVVRRLLAQ